MVMKWRDHTEFLLSTLSSFKECNKFTDVTLVSSDAIEFNAHQFILKNASLVFENVLKIKNELSPIIYLPELTSNVMITILEFIYNGQVLIHNEENMEEFLLAASYLKLNFDGGNENGYFEQINNENDKIKEIKEKKEAVKNLNDNINYYEEIRIELMTDAKNSKLPGIKSNEEERDQDNIEIEMIEPIVNENAYDDKYSIFKDIFSNAATKLEQSEGIDFKLDTKDEMKIERKFITNKANQPFCTICGKKYASKQVLKKHIETMHNGVRYRCNECSYLSSDKANLRRHVLTLHEGLKFPCQNCDYHATDSGNLRRHNDSVHLNLKRFQCSQCEYCTNDNGNLRRHLLNHFFKVKK